MSATTRYCIKRLNLGSRKPKQRRTIAKVLEFSDAKDIGEIRMESETTVAKRAGGVGQNRRLSTNNSL